MVLKNRYVDPLVTLYDGFVNLGALESLAVGYVNLLV
jgi:hypothetical protein